MTSFYDSAALVNPDKLHAIVNPEYIGIPSIHQITGGRVNLVYTGSYAFQLKRFWYMPDREIIWVSVDI